MNHSRSDLARRRMTGFTMLELLVVIAVAGLVMAIALPKMGPVRDSAGVTSAKQLVQSYIATARQAAIRRGGTAKMVIAGDNLSVTSTLDGVTTGIAPAVDLGEEYGVALTTTLTEVQFNARGLARLPSEGRLKLTRSSRSDSVCVTILGMTGKCGL